MEEEALKVFFNIHSKFSFTDDNFSGFFIFIIREEVVREENEEV